MTTIPPFTRPIYNDREVTNKGDLPLWSGKGEPPEIGTEVQTFDRFRHRIMITGYEVVAGWLMALGYRVEEPDKRGNLAGAEIHYPSDDEAAD